MSIRTEQNPKKITNLIHKTGHTYTGYEKESGNKSSKKILSLLPNCHVTEDLQVLWSSFTDIIDDLKLDEAIANLELKVPT